jgi:hypothetical protein
MTLRNSSVGKTSSMDDILGCESLMDGEVVFVLGGGIVLQKDGMGWDEVEHTLFGYSHSA